MLTELLTLVERGFAVDAEYVRRAERFLAHQDRGSSARVYDFVRSSGRRRGRWERYANHEIASALPKYLRRHRLYFPAMRRAFKLWNLLPADPNLVLFESDSGKRYADGPRYIYEELVRSRPEIKKVWAYSGKLPTPDPNTRVVKRLSPSYYYYYLARARFWVNNQSFPHYIRRRRDGVFVQTWHGTPLKRMGHDLPEVHGRDAGYLARATAGAAQWTVLVSPNAFATEAIRSAYRYTGDAIEVGYPRNDLLHRIDRDELAARIRARLGIRAEQRVVLYAPTFRDDQLRPGRYDFELPFDLERMHRELGDETVLLLRLHALVKGRIGIPSPLRDHVRDVSRYSEVQELLLIADVLVTDYSSLFFDYASLRRPMVFYAYDLDTYRDKLRGFYLDYEKVVPGPIVETEDELIHALANLSDVEIDPQDVRDEFLARYCPRDDGHAAERVVESVFGSQRRPSTDG